VCGGGESDGGGDGSVEFVRMLVVNCDDAVPQLIPAQHAKRSENCGTGRSKRTFETELGRCNKAKAVQQS
jgi:hypothetical protein